MFRKVLNVTALAADLAPGAMLIVVGVIVGTAGATGILWH